MSLNGEEEGAGTEVKVVVVGVEVEGGEAVITERWTGHGSLLVLDRRCSKPRYNAANCILKQHQWLLFET